MRYTSWSMVLPLAPFKPKLSRKAEGMCANPLRSTMRSAIGCVRSIRAGMNDLGRCTEEKASTGKAGTTRRQDTYLRAVYQVSAIPL